MFRKYLKSSLLHVFTSFALVLIAAGFLLGKNFYYQLQIITLGVVMYVAFALLYHYKDKSLTFEIILEYILIAVLVLVIFLGITI